MISCLKILNKRSPLPELSKMQLICLFKKLLKSMFRVLLGHLINIKIQLKQWLVVLQEGLFTMYQIVMGALLVTGKLLRTPLF